MQCLPSTMPGQHDQAPGGREGLVSWLVELLGFNRNGDVKSTKEMWANHQWKMFLNISDNSRGFPINGDVPLYDFPIIYIYTPYI